MAVSTRTGPAAVISGLSRIGRFPYTGTTGGPAKIIAGERMVKEQQMRWTPRGARLLLQVRTHVPNDQLAGPFRR